MKKIISALVSLAIVIGCLPMTFALADGTDTTATFNLQGSGTAASPYLITNADDLKAMRDAVNKAGNVANSNVSNYSTAHYMLTADIDLGGEEWTPIGKDDKNQFLGYFDGNGHVVKNFQIPSQQSYVGFFGMCGSWQDYSKIHVSNLGIENAEITANGTKGVMLGRGAGYFTNCYVKNSKLSGTGVAGGFIGTARHKSEFTNCYVYDVKITQVAGNESELGGFCGKLENSKQEYKFTNCYSAKVSVTNPGSGKYSPFYPFLNNTYRYQEKTKSDSTIEPAVVPVITNCYSADTHFSGKDGQNQPIKYKPEAAGGVEGATLEGICAALVTDGSAYTSDPSVNGGYPYLKNVSVWDGTTTNTNFAGGGTEDNPYLITSAAELAGLAKLIADTTDTTGLNSVTNGSKTMYLVKSNTYYKLTCDIDLNNKEWTPIGNVQYRFDGVFDGDGHTVKNVSMTQEKNAAGLFGATGKNSRILNLGVDGVSLKTRIGSLGTYAFVARCVGFGGLAGSIMTGGSDTKPMIENCFAKNVVIEPTDKQMGNNHSGGLVGNVLKESDSNNTFYISNSYTYNVTIKNYIDKGAFIGCNDCVLTYDGSGCSCGECVPNIKNCYAGGTINIVDVYGTGNDDGASARDKKFAFGNFGSANADGLVNCYTSAEVMNEDSSKAYYNKINYGKSAGDITTALVTDGSAYKTDSAINGDFPSLKWENAENIVSHKDIIIAAVSESENANNNVQVTVSAKGDTANKTVYIATYDGSGRLIDVDSIALSEFTSNTAKVTNVTADGAANIKVFVWDSNMNSVATMFSRK